MNQRSNEYDYFGSGRKTRDGIREEIKTDLGWKRRCRVDTWSTRVTSRHSVLPKSLVIQEQFVFTLSNYL